MNFSNYFPIWKQLTAAQQAQLEAAASFRTVKKGTVLHRGDDDCLGLLLVRSGQLRAYILSDEGREITLYRLFEMDICVLSASCMLHSIQSDVTIEAEKDTDLWIIQPQVYKALMAESAPAANYINELLASRFSDVMWLIEQVMWKSFDKRLAAFLAEETRLEGTPRLEMTHETIGNHLGTAREVVTRMLRWFQSEGLVKLSRGVVEVTDQGRLEQLAEG